MTGSLEENGRKMDLFMAPDVKCTGREPNTTHLLAVIDLPNILKLGYESFSFTGYSIFTLTLLAVLTKYPLSGGKGSIEFVYNSF